MVQAMAAYRNSLVSVRTLLSEAESVDAISGERLEACRADLLVVRAQANAQKARGSALASLFELSPEITRLIERLAVEGLDDGPDRGPEGGDHPHPSSPRNQHAPSQPHAA
ncbi:MAG: hypothetical protein ACYS22_14175 [Planctomycetota bacterium]